MDRDLRLTFSPGRHDFQALAFFLGSSILNSPLELSYCEGGFCCYATCRNKVDWNVG
jgi:hypothetical protein